MFRLLKRLLAAIVKQPDAVMPILNEYRLEAIKKAIASRWPNVPVGVVFDDTAFNSNPPTTHEEAVERVKLNRLGLTIATAIERRNKIRAMMFSMLVFFAVAGSFFFQASQYFNSSPWMNSTAAMILGFTWTGAAFVCLWFMLGISPTLYAMLLPRVSPLTQADVDDANAFVARVLRKWTDKDGTPPADLADRWRTLSVDANGEPVDGQLLPIDFRVSEFRETIRAAFGGEYWFSLLVITILCSIAAFIHSFSIAISHHVGMQGRMFAASADLGTMTLLYGIAGVFAMAMWGIQAAKIFFMPDRAERRAVQAQIASETSPTSRLVEEVGREPFVVSEHARVRQLENAASDDSAFLRIGTATKAMAARRDPFSPTEPVPFGLTVRDLSTHLLMLGDTGTGKTAGGIRPILWQWLEAEAGGAVILDGKGALPREVATDPRFKLITPDTAAYNPIAGLTPDDVANTLYEQNAAGDGDSAFWEQSAMRLIRSSATLLEIAVRENLGKWRWTLGDLYKVTCADADMKKLRSDLSAFKDAGGLVEHEERAASYRFVEFPETPEKMMGSILGYAQAWLTTIVDNKDLSDWISSPESDVDIREALTGGIIAFDLPEAIYGPAGPALSAMVKSQLYRALKIRGDLSAAQKVDPRQTAVLVLVDECQEIVAQDDVAMLPIARSLGLRAFFSTQALDGFYLKLGEDAAQTLLAQFRSVVSLTVNGERTKKFVSDRMGAGYRMQLFSTTSAQSDAAAAGIAATRTPGGYTAGSVGHQVAWRSETTNAMRGDFGIGGDIRAATDQLAGTLGLHDLVSSMSIYRHRRQSPATFSVAKTAFVEPEEVPLLTSAPFLALASINRGNVPRRDLIELSPMFEFPSSASDAEVIEGEAVEVAAEELEEI